MVRINSLQLENIKRVKAVSIEPNPTGLTVIGGKNGQGKTSVLDAIAWALGGEKYRPTQAQRDGSVLPPKLKVTLSNGLVVERSGKNSALKVLDPSGKKGGQQILNEFVEGLALDLPKFMNSTQKEKAEILLKVIGVGDKLAVLDAETAKLYQQRHAIGQIADQKRKYADEMEEYPGLPDVPVSAMELIRQQQEILARNGRNQEMRNQHAELEAKKNRLAVEVERLTVLLENAKGELSAVSEAVNAAEKTVNELTDESTAELEESIRTVEDTNRKIRCNLDKEKAREDARNYSDQYDTLTHELEAVRNERQNLLADANLPLPGLSVEEGKLTYNGVQWDGLSGAEQLMISTAIVRALNPQCGFVLMDKLEQMDTDTLQEFGVWLESEGLQVIATRVSTGDECSIIIEDGTVAKSEKKEMGEIPVWNGGVK